MKTAKQWAKEIFSVKELTSHGIENWARNIQEDALRVDVVLNVEHYLKESGIKFTSDWIEKTFTTVLYKVQNEAHNLGLNEGRRNPRGNSIEPNHMEDSRPFFDGEKLNHSGGEAKIFLTKEDITNEGKRVFKEEPMGRMVYSEHTLTIAKEFLAKSGFIEELVTANTGMIGAVITLIIEHSEHEMDRRIEKANEELESINRELGQRRESASNIKAQLGIWNRF